MTDTERPRREILSPDELSERLRYEYERGARHGLPLCVIALHFIVWDGEAEGAQQRLDRQVSDHFARSVRISDGVYHYGLRGCYIAVLPATGTEVGHVVRHRLEQRANHRPVAEIGPCKIDVIPVDVGVPDVGSLLARIEEHFRSQELRPLGTGSARPPAERVRVRGLNAFESALRTELNLAGRDASHLSVVSLFSSGGEGTSAGLLAECVANIAPQVVRATDAVFSIGPSHIALVMPRTHPGAAWAVGHRLSHVLEKCCPEAPFGLLTVKVLEFDRTHRDVPSILGTLRELAPVGDGT